MAYEQDGYVLHKRDVELKGGKTQTIYYFCKKGNKPKSGEPCDKPDNMVVILPKYKSMLYAKYENNH
jgi:hypothetical protein